MFNNLPDADRFKPATPSKGHSVCITRHGGHLNSINRASIPYRAAPKYCPIIPFPRNVLAALDLNYVLHMAYTIQMLPSIKVYSELS